MARPSSGALGAYAPRLKAIAFGIICGLIFLIGACSAGEAWGHTYTQLVRKEHPRYATCSRCLRGVGHSGHVGPLQFAASWKHSRKCGHGFKDWRNCPTCCRTVFERGQRRYGRAWVWRHWRVR